MAHICPILSIFCSTSAFQVQFYSQRGTSISLNFQKVSRNLEGSYPSKFQNEGGSNPSKFFSRLSGKKCSPMLKMFKTIFRTTFLLRIYDFFGRYKCIFISNREKKLTNKANLIFFSLEFPPKDIITCRFLSSTCQFELETVFLQLKMYTKKGQNACFFLNSERLEPP